MRAILFITLLVVSTIYAIWRGDRSARQIAIVLISAALVTWLLPSNINARFSSVSIPLFLIDCGTWVALLWIASRDDHEWTLWMASFQGMSVLSHLAGMGPGINRLVYFVAAVAWAWPIQALLLWAVLTDDRGRKRAPPSLFFPR